MQCNSIAKGSVYYYSAKIVELNLISGDERRKQCKQVKKSIIYFTMLIAINQYCVCMQMTMNAYSSSFLSLRSCMLGLRRVTVDSSIVLYPCHLLNVMYILSSVRDVGSWATFSIQSSPYQYYHSTITYVEVILTLHMLPLPTLNGSELL